MQFIGTFALIGLLAAGTQLGVDFSGTWVLESTPSQSDTPQLVAVDQPIIRTNVRGEPMPPTFFRISIRRVTASATTTESRDINVVGGSVDGSAGSRWNRRTHNETVWDENSLVFSDGSYTGDSPRTGEWTERREVWSLAAEGSVLVLESSTESSDSGPRTEKLVYKRRR